MLEGTANTKTRLMHKLDTLASAFVELCPNVPEKEELIKFARFILANVNQNSNDQEFFVTGVDNYENDVALIVRASSKEEAADIAKFINPSIHICSITRIVDNANEHKREQSGTQSTEDRGHQHRAQQISKHYS